MGIELDVDLLCEIGEESVLRPGEADQLNAFFGSLCLERSTHTIKECLCTTLLLSFQRVFMHNALQ